MTLAYKLDIRLCHPLPCMFIYHRKYCNVDARSTARQRLGKQARNIHVANNTEEEVFSMLSTPCNSRSVFYVVRATQQYKSCVFCVVRVASI
jgi:hypothetical protein